MATETRFVKASVRKENAIGAWHDQIFALTVAVTGSYHALCDEVIRLIRAEGFETNHIIDHSTKRECL